jgi:hypothetical protein
MPAVHVARVHMVYAMFHRSWPLGSEEGRAMAEHLFGPEPVADLPPRRTRPSTAQLQDWPAGASH